MFKGGDLSLFSENRSWQKAEEVKEEIEEEFIKIEDNVWFFIEIMRFLAE